MRRSLVRMAVVTAFMALLAGCGGSGGSGPSAPASPFVGSYAGTYTVSAGPNVGETKNFTLTVNNSAQVSATVTDGAGHTANLAGTISFSTGNFSGNGTFTTSGNTVSVNGTIQQIAIDDVHGTGTFTVSNGNSGQIRLQKNV